MALTTQLSAATRSAMADVLTALLVSGFLDIYDGAQPATPDVAVTTQVKLARLSLLSPAFAASASGVALANAIVSAAASASGNAAWFRATKANGTAVIDGSVGTAGCNIN